MFEEVLIHYYLFIYAALAIRATNEYRVSILKVKDMTDFFS